MTDEKKLVHIEELLKNEMLQLNFKKLTVNKVSKRYNLPKKDVNEHYILVRSRIIKKSINRGLLYLFLGSVSLFIGIAGTFGDSKYIFFGALLAGTAGVLSAIGLFVLALKGTIKTK